MGGGAEAWGMLGDRLSRWGGSRTRGLMWASRGTPGGQQAQGHLEWGAEVQP